MSENCLVIVIYPIYGQFRAIWSNLDSERIVCETYIFINSKFTLTKTESKTKTFLAQLSRYCLGYRYYFSQNADFLQKHAGIRKIKGVMAL